MIGNRIIKSQRLIIFILLIGAQTPFPSLTGEIPNKAIFNPAVFNEEKPVSPHSLQQTPEELAAILAAELLLSPMPYYIDLPVILR